VHWPISRGQLNVHGGAGGSLTAVLADLEAIWSHVIQKQLEIPLKDLKVQDRQLAHFTRQCLNITSQKFGHTYSLKGFSLF
jgi:hypothetical protein